LARRRQTPSRAGRWALPNRPAFDDPRPDRLDASNPASGSNSGFRTHQPVNVSLPLWWRAGVGVSDSAIMGGMLQARTDLTSRIDAVDPEVAAAIRDEFERQKYTLELIPWENFATSA